MAIEGFKVNGEMGYPTQATPERMNLLVDQANNEISILNNQPRAQYTATVSKAIQTAAWTTLNWGQKVFDTNNFIEPTDNETIVINESGFYAVTGAVNFSNNTVGMRSIRIQKNGNEDIGYDGKIPISTTTRCNLALMHFFNAGETIKVLIYQDSGVELSTALGNGFPMLTIAKIGGTPP